MKFSVQVIVHPDDDTDASPVVRKVFANRDDLAPDTLGLQLAEAKYQLASVQDAVAGQQASAAIAKQVACPHCGVPRRSDAPSRFGVTDSCAGRAALRTQTIYSSAISVAEDAPPPYGVGDAGPCRCSGGSAPRARRPYGRLCRTGDSHRQPGRVLSARACSLSGATVTGRRRRGPVAPGGQDFRS